ncbi:MAG: sigma-70 family RNA polymerase sigma factor [Chloroflexota bacterium]
MTAADMNQPSDEELVELARRREPGGLNALYERYYDRMFRFAYTRLGNRQDAEDVTQDVFLKMVDKIGSFKWQGVPFAAWLFKIGHNSVTDFHRKSNARGPQTHLEDLPLIASDNPEETVVNKLVLEAVNENIQRLSPAQQQVLALRFGADLSVLDTARILNKAEGTVKATQFQAFQALRKLMANEGQR